MSELALIIAPKFALPEVLPSPAALTLKDKVLADSALIPNITPRTAAENRVCFEARRRIETLSKSLQKDRKAITDPINDWLRIFKAAIDRPCEELDQEAGRLAELEKQFKFAEDKRIREEQEAQQREIERIERERQAEIARLAREQAEREAAAARAAAEAARVVREAQEAADRAAREATNAKARKEAEAAQKLAREQAEAARVESERLAAIAAEEAVKNARQMSLVQAEAQEAASLAAKPVERTREVGQVARKVWKITSINDHQLYKARPDLVSKFEWDVVGIKAILATGAKLPGVTAVEDYTMSTRGTRGQSFIEA
jgi:hypothetical protein